MENKNSKKNNASKDKDKKKRSGNWFKERFSELKKVSWPSFPEVMKTLGVVLMVVVIFFAVFLVFDLILGEGHSLLISGIQSGTGAETRLLSSIITRII